MEVAISFLLMVLHAVRGYHFKTLTGCKENFAFADNSNVFLESRSRLDCARSCSLDGRCLGFNLCETGSPASPVPFLCQLVSQWSQDSCGLLSPAPGCSFWKMDIQCVHGWVDKKTMLCQCHSGAFGSVCQHAIQDCMEGMEMGMTGTWALTLVQPLGAPSPFWTKCNFDYGFTAMIGRDSSCSGSDAFLKGTWTSLQKQQDQCQEDCCFIGLDNMFYLLNQGPGYLLSVYIRGDFPLQTAKISYYAQMLNDSGRYTLKLRDPHSTYNPADDGFQATANPKFCSPDHDCSGCATTAGHSGWFDDNSSVCAEVEGFRASLLWPVDGALRDAYLIVFEAERRY